MLTCLIKFIYYGKKHINKFVLKLIIIICYMRQKPLNGERKMTVKAQIKDFVFLVSSLLEKLLSNNNRFDSQNKLKNKNFINKP